MTTSLTPDVIVLGNKMAWDQPFMRVRWTVPMDIPGFCFSMNGKERELGARLLNRYGSLNISGSGGFLKDEVISTTFHVYDLAEAVGSGLEAEVGLYLNRYGSVFEKRFSIDVELANVDIAHPPLNRVL